MICFVAEREAPLTSLPHPMSPEAIFHRQTSHNYLKSATLDAVRAADVAKLAIGSGDVTRTPMLLEHHFPAVSSRLPIL